MTITRTTIITALNEELNASESTTPSARMLRAMRTGLRFVSGLARWSCLHTSKTDYTTAAGDESIAWPANFRELDVIKVNDGTYDSAPLTEISYEKWQEHREDETTADYDQPEEFARREQKFYLQPRPDANSGSNYTVKVYYWRWHPDDSTILFGEDFEEVVNNAVIAAYLESKGRHVQAQYYKALAVGGAAELERTHAVDRKPRFIKYHDL